MLRGYKRFIAILCVFLLVLPILSYWRINQVEQHFNRWGPRIDSEIVHRNLAIYSPIPIVLDHEAALSLITESGFKLQMDFDGFDNQEGANRFIVPNIVHYLRLKQARFTFTDYLCLLSVHINQKPNFIIIHTDVLKSGGFKGN